ncbi:MAG: putative PEP-CTERM system TPR-repeat lipoprotein [Gammaproteobacteria bacterium]|jgi:putative PEP-CTERM system TPR-repeat lipoprotein
MVNMTRYKRLQTFFFWLILSTNLSAETVSKLIAKSDTAKSQQEYQTALIHLKNASKEDPKDISVRLKLAQLFVHIGQGVQAIVELDKAHRLGANPVELAVLSAKAKMLQGEFDELTENVDLLDLPQSDIAILRAIQGHALFEQRRLDQAKQMFQRALLLSPDELEVQLGLAKLFKINGETQKEKQQIIKLLDQYKGNAEVLIVAGSYYRSNNEYEKALELFNQAGEIQPSNVNVWFGAVRSHIGKRSFNDAKFEIQKVLNNYPEHQVGNYLLSVIAYEEGDYARAKAAIDIVLKGQKRQYEALKLLSTIQFQQQEYSDSEKNIKKYLKFHPDDIQAQKTLASIYLKRKQGVLALEVLNPLEILDDAYIYSMIATAYLTMGNSDKSELYIQKSIKAAPNDKAIQRHFQRSRLEAGESIQLEFIDTDYSNFLGEGHIPILNLLRQKKYDRAIEVINGYMKTMPDNALLHYLLGSTFLYQGAKKEAQKEFESSLKFKSDFIESRINLAKIYQIDGKERDAEREYREVLRLSPNNDQSMIALAGIFKRAGDEEEMLKWLKKSRKVNTASLASREVLEQYYRSKGDRERALDVSNEMVNIQPQNISLLLKNANNQKAVNRLDLAIKTFKKIASLKPEESSTWFGLARLQLLDNDLITSKANIEKGLKLEPQNLVAKVILIEIDIKNNQLSSALTKAEKLQQQHPESSAGFDMLGDIYMALKKPEQAIKQYKQSVKMRYDSDTYIKLHFAFNRNNEVENGFKQLEKWVQSFPEDLKLKEVLATTYQRRGILEKARDLYEEIIQKSKNNDRILNKLALVALSLESPMSIEYAEMAYNLDSKSVKNKDTLGWVLLNTQNSKKALVLLKEASEASPSDPDIRYHYAVALTEQGNKPQAENQLFIALSSKDSFLNRKQANELLQKLKSQ